MTKLFARNEMLDDFMNSLEITGDSLEHAVTAALSAHGFAEGTPINTISGPVAEEVVKLANRRHSAKYDIPVNWDPLKEGARAGNYTFHPGDTGIKINLVNSYRSPTGQLVVDKPDLDDFGIFENLPVIIETKIRKRITGGRSSIASALDYGSISKRAKPIKRYYRTKNIGYAAVIPEKYGTNPLHRRKLTDISGYVIPFYTNADEFKEEIREVLDIVGFDFIEQPLPFRQVA